MKRNDDDAMTPRTPEEAKKYWENYFDKQRREAQEAAELAVKVLDVIDPFHKEREGR